MGQATVTPPAHVLFAEVPLEIKTFISKYPWLSFGLLKVPKMFFLSQKDFFFPCMLPSNQFLFDPNDFSLFSFSLAPI